MMQFDLLLSPTQFLEKYSGLPLPDDLRAYDQWMDQRGRAISAAVDRAGTPHLKQFDPFGNRIELLEPIA